MNASPTITSDAAARLGGKCTPGGGLLHPISLAAVAALVVNDHALKAAYPGAVTGKLSDAAGLVFFPLLLQAFVEVAHAAARPSWRPSSGVLVACAAATAACFAAINLSAPAAELYRHGLGLLQWPFRALAAAAAGAGAPEPLPVEHTLDPSDLIALPAAGLAVWLGRIRTREDRR